MQVHATFLAKNSQEGLGWNRKQAGFHTGLWQSDRGFCDVWCQENVANLGERFETRFTQSVASGQQSRSMHESYCATYEGVSFLALRAQEILTFFVTNSEGTNKIELYTQHEYRIYTWKQHWMHVMAKSSSSVRVNLLPGGILCWSLKCLGQPHKSPRSAQTISKAFASE